MFSRGIIALAIAALVVCASVAEGVDLDAHLAKFVASEEMNSAIDVPCDVCEAAIVTLDLLLGDNHTDIDILYFFANACTIAKIEAAEVCYGIVVNEMGPEILYIIRTLGYTPKNLCEFVGVCSNSTSSTFLSSHPTKHIAQQDSTPVGGSRGTTQGYNLQYNPAHQYWIQFTDMHVDRYYQVGSNADCGFPTCCRTFEANATSIAGYWGDYSCDTTVQMVEATLNWIVSSLPVPVDLIMWTGDNPGHDVWEQSIEENLAATELLVSLIAAAFPKTATFPTLGNHESCPVDQYHAPEKSWLTQAVADYWGPDGAGWLDEDTAASVASTGYYTTLMPAGPNATAPLRVVSMNTYYGDKINFYLLLDGDDPGGQLAWLETTLAAARAAGERVVVTGHIPCLSNGEVQYEYCAKYTPIIANYSDIIVALIFGHTHTDQFATISADPDGPWDGPAAAVYFISSSVTTFTGLNPGFRVYEFDPVAMEIVNWYQFISNLTEANAAGPDVAPQFSLEYSAKEAYGLSDFSPASFQQLATQTFVENQDAFQLYYNYFHTMSFTNPCEGECKINMLCSTQSSSAERLAQCVAALSAKLL